MAEQIYICHEYYEPNHLSAIYNCAGNNGYEVADWIVLSNKSILKRAYKLAIFQRKPLEGMGFLVHQVISRLRLLMLKNKIIIVGIAPYDYLMNKYSRIFQKNHSIYYSSWQIWDGTCFPRGDISNKSNFEHCVSQCFLFAACVSKTTAMQLGTLNKTQVVFHSIDVDAYKHKDRFDPDNIKFVFVGRFVSRKHIDYIIEWIKRKLNSKLFFYFVGEGEMKEQIKSLCDECKNVYYLGYWDKKEIQNRICEFDYLVLPSEREPFGIVLLEALASGVPCITTKENGPGEIISDGETGFLFSLNEGYEAFEATMDRACGIDEHEYYLMSKNCICESKSYDFTEIWKRWEYMLQINTKEMYLK